MLVLVTDAFVQAVEEARMRLNRTEGQTVSIRELARRAGINYRTLAYNLSPERQVTGRRISADLVRALAQVLPISEEELSRAAQVAAGYTVSEELPGDLGTAVIRFLGSDEVPAEEKAALTAQLAEIVAEEVRKSAESRRNDR